ncbi:PhnE/PtxC family ABC transporter permease [Maledivibacter halophilus]|uniref:Phosphonate transport system permease protein n=1 Tax=Maledivibacter halophilus TaxID=36842 RepID=A0A1T5J971_9FIRM|nr:ABC transporter permease subunit [Maledivibacter halophilus]SKC47929.1 phosphonate transport system permease protein [Maledivibacter halophilus]
MEGSFVSTAGYRKTKKGKIKIKRATPSSIAIKSTLFILLGLTIYGFIGLDSKGVELFEALSSSLINLKKMFFEANYTHFTIKEALYQILITFGLALLTTLIGSFFALILGLLAAENLSNKKVSTIIKGFVAFIRAVPTVLWVLIFAVAAGLGSVAAVIGMTFHTVGYLIKSYSESFEELDAGVIEALKASGANWWQIVFQAVLPSSATYLLSWTFIRFEINFTNAVAMGAAAGAGGIGFELFMASGFYFDLREVGFITYLVLFSAIILEVLSTKLKNRLVVSN